MTLELAVLGLVLVVFQFMAWYGGVTVTRTYRFVRQYGTLAGTWFNFVISVLNFVACLSVLGSILYLASGRIS